MKRNKIFRLAVIVGILLSAIYLLRIYIKAKVEEMTFELFEEDEKQIEFAKKESIQRIAFNSNGNTLYANWANHDESSPSVFILHGNGETLSDWVETQVFLKKLGYNTFVFDYSGFGSSQGIPTVETLDEDAKNAWMKFCDLSNESSSRVAFGHSLGSAILLGSVNTYPMIPDNLIIHAPFSSAREIAIHLGTADRRWAWILPDMWNNVENIQNIPITNICIIHSKSDEITPYKMSVKISEQNKDVNLLLLDGYNHNSLYESVNRTFWNEVFNCKRN
ncbi:MAG: alpha/beta fold hydrolase [Bacteroidales bacterium]|nr:alpha/beta fold hydrolase [Bacteroidales bacterium]